MSQFHPNSRGVATRWFRLAANVSAAATAATATPAPTRLDRVGTAVGPRPGSSAMRTPVTAVGGAPALGQAPGDAGDAPGPRFCRPPPPGLAREAPRGDAPDDEEQRQERAGTTAKGQQVERHPGVRLGLSGRPHRHQRRGHDCGNDPEGDTHRGRDGEGHHRGHEELRPRQAESGERSVRDRLREQLAGDRLGDDEQAGGGDNQCEEPERDRLGRTARSTLSVVTASVWYSIRPSCGTASVAALKAVMSAPGFRRAATPKYDSWSGWLR